jgi:peptidyl-tRNA hydrolase
MSKLYILVRGDLSKSQQAVQASHATAEFMLYENEVRCWCRECPSEKQWYNGTIVLLKVRCLEDLLMWKERIAAKKISLAEFKEPDIGNETTAIAAYGTGLEDLVKDLPLV